MFDDDVDPDDELFRRALQRAAGPAPDAFTSLEAFANVRRTPAPARRSVAGARLAVLAAAAAVVVAVLAAANAERRHDTGRRPAASAPTTATSVRAASTTRPTGMSSISEDAPTSTAASTTAGTVPTSGVLVEPVDDTAPDATDPAGGQGSGGSDGGPAAGGGSSGRGPGAGATAAPPSSVAGAVTTAAPPGGAGTTAATGTAATTAAPTATRSFPVTGGTITVTIRNGAFGKPTMVTTAGWDADVRDAAATRIDIRFKNDGNENNVRLVLLANGDVQVTQGRQG